MIESTFLGHGFVRCEMIDAESRQIQLAICIPCYLFQVATPLLLGAGVVDSPKIHLPISVWVPRYADERMVPVARQEPRAGEKVYTLIRDWVVRYTEFFTQVSNLFMDPTDAVPILPLGTYVDITYRCSLDRIPEVLHGLQALPIAGIPEFQFALSEVLHRVLSRIESSTPKLGM